MGFAVNVGRWAGRASEEMDRLNKAIILELFSSVILDTPVLEGRLRGNWVISSNNPAEGTVEVTDPQGNKTVQNVQSFISQLPPGKDFDVYLTNNLPYAYRIEYEGYSKTKAPEGMVRKNLIRISGNLAA